MTQYSGKKNFIKYIQDTAPNNVKQNDLWYDTINNKLKIFNSGVWNLVATVFTPTTANFTVDDDTAVINQSLQFTDQSTGVIVAWSWDFGDGTTSTDQNPTHAYTANGQYTVSLTVTDSHNYQDTKTVTNFITVANDPGASFVASTIAEHINTDIQFTDQSTSNGTISAWQWDFGDGTTSTEQNPIHQYTTSGLYTVSLTVTDEFGSDTMTRNNYIAIDMPPTAEFVSDTQSAYIHDNIQFTDQSTSYGTITSWQWDFGDGNTTTVQNPVYSYSAVGNYTITLTVTDEFGSDTQIKIDYITIFAHGTGYEYGYCMGGADGSANLSTIDRITFPFDSGTATYVGNLSVTKRWVAGCNSSNYGYAMGGYDGSNNFSTIDRIVFPFDLGTATHVGNLSGIKCYVAGCNSSNYGYIMGGAYYNGSNWMCYSIIDRITFPFDSGTATHVGNLSGSRMFFCGECNSSNYGYAIGGSYLSIIDRITFPFNSGTATHVGNLNSSRCWASGCNSSNYGYAMGGNYYDNGNNILFSTIDRITFPFDFGISSSVGNLSGDRHGVAGCNSSDHGYAMGGTSGSSVIDRIIFPFDSGTAIHVGNLSGSKGAAVGCDGTDFVTLFI